LQKLPSNNSLTVELMNITDEGTDAQEDSEGDSEPDEPYKRTQTIDETIVYGEKTLEIKIKTEKPQEPTPEKPEEPKPEKKPCKFPFYCP
jgi:hypothetical protein